MKWITPALTFAFGLWLGFLVRDIMVASLSGQITTVQLLSVFISVVGIPVGFLLGKRLNDRKAEKDLLTEKIKEVEKPLEAIKQLTEQYYQNEKAVSQDDRHKILSFFRDTSNNLNQVKESLEFFDLLENERVKTKFDEFLEQLVAYKASITDSAFEKRSYKVTADAHEKQAKLYESLLPALNRLRLEVIKN